MIAVFCDSNIFIDALPTNDEGKILDKLMNDPSKEHILLESVEKEVIRVLTKFKKNYTDLFLKLCRIDDFNEFQAEFHQLLKKRGMSPLERIQQKFGYNELFNRRKQLLDIFFDEIDEIERKFYFFTSNAKRYPFNREEIEESRKWIHSKYGKVFGRRKADETHICGILNYEAKKKIFITNDNFFHHKLDDDFLDALEKKDIKIYTATEFFNTYYLKGYL